MKTATKTLIKAMASPMVSKDKVEKEKERASSSPSNRYSGPLPDGEYSRCVRSKHPDFPYRPVEVHSVLFSHPYWPPGGPRGGGLLFSNLLPHVYYQEYLPGKTIYEIDSPSSGVYILLQGTIHMVGGGKVLRSLSRRLDRVGEEGVIYMARRHSSAVAGNQGTTSVLFVDADAYRLWFADDARRLDKPLLDIVKSCGVFSSWDTCALVEISKSLERVVFQRGDCVYKQGEVADRLYIVEDGEVFLLSNNPQPPADYRHPEENFKVKSKRAITQSLVSRITAQGVFGDEDGFESTERKFTSEVNSPKLHCLSLSFTTLYALLPQNQAFVEMQLAAKSRSEYRDQRRTIVDQKTSTNSHCNSQKNLTPAQRISSVKGTLTMLRSTDIDRQLLRFLRKKMEKKARADMEPSIEDPGLAAVANMGNPFSTQPPRVNRKVPEDKFCKLLVRAGHSIKRAVEEISKNSQQDGQNRVLRTLKLDPTENTITARSRHRPMKSMGERIESAWTNKENTALEEDNECRPSAFVTQPHAKGSESARSLHQVLSLGQMKVRVSQASQQSSRERRNNKIERHQRAASNKENVTQPSDNSIDARIEQQNFQRKNNTAIPSPRHSHKDSTTVSPQLSSRPLASRPLKSTISFSIANQLQHQQELSSTFNQQVAAAIQQSKQQDTGTITIPLPNNGLYKSQRVMRSQDHSRYRRMPSTHSTLRGLTNPAT